MSGRIATLVPERADEQRVRRPVTADDYATFVLRLASGPLATITLSSVAHHRPGHLAQITGTKGSLVLTGETKLELGAARGALADVSEPDEVAGQVTPDTMWARSFARLMRDLVGRLEGRPAAGQLPTFHDGLAVQRVMDAVRTGQRVQLD